MKLEEYVSIHRPRIIQRVQEIFTERPDIFSSKDTAYRLKEFITKGKTLRGLIVCLASEMYGLEIGNDAITLACAIEINHSGLLIHDDIIDRDELRRGEKTLFAQYSQMGKDYKVSDERFYGMSVAICAGDVTFFVVPQILSEIESKNIRQILAYFYRELEYVALAEMYEFGIGQRAVEPNEEEIERIYEYKTARYTFSLPLVLGAMLSGIKESEQQKLENIGKDLGIIFQIKDDEIGLLGQEKEIGKPVGSDIRENKKTLIRLMLFRKVNKEEKMRLEQIFGNQNILLEDINYVKKVVDSYKITKEIHEILIKRADGVFKKIEELNTEDRYKKLLAEFVQYNLNRSY